MSLAYLRRSDRDFSGAALGLPFTGSVGPAGQLLAAFVAHLVFVFLMLVSVSAHSLTLLSVRTCHRTKALVTQNRSSGAPLFFIPALTLAHKPDSSLALLGRRTWQI